MISRTLAATALAALAAAALAGSASPASASATTSASARPCGGPHKVGDKAVWYNCSGVNQSICVRQYFPLANYRAVVAPRGEHQNSWRWTIDMTTDMSRC
ncbi:hypothetical protein [Sinosporangium siamense]|uniref:Secreted protein n=1 Tax=Sinosporangium siamense TaxID=1367973 RepID=A0A919RL56_9ACTN|nr:hypothetical protein [Sinosporangium siamense]GII95217.1 hypothetical protein Ssi02_54480 [Sinosporangium siamense]